MRRSIGSPITRVVRFILVLLLAAGGLAAATGRPAGGREGHTAAARPRPYLLLIHGGAWYRVGTARMAANVPRLRSWGYRTDLVRYRPRRAAFPDVLAAYDRLRRRVGSATPICAYGSSAGAQMGLMLAIRRPSLACVVAQAAPTDLERLRPSLRRHARAAFGRRLARWSPAAYRVPTPVLLEQATNDPVVPFGQMAAMHHSAPRSRTFALTPGPARWIHSDVSERSLARSLAIERAFLLAHARPPG